MPYALLIIVGGVGAHWILCLLVGSPWWVPDLTLLTVVFVIAASPSRWWLAAGAAGLATVCWAVRFPVVVLLWYGALGVGLKFLSDRWDLADLRVQLLVVGVAETLWIILQVWLQGAGVVPLLGVMVVHVGLTLLMVPAMRGLALVPEPMGSSV